MLATPFRCIHIYLPLSKILPLQLCRFREKLVQKTKGHTEASVCLFVFIVKENAGIERWELLSEGGGGGGYGIGLCRRRDCNYCLLSGNSCIFLIRLVWWMRCLSFINHETWWAFLVVLTSCHWGRERRWDSNVSLTYFLEKKFYHHRFLFLFCVRCLYLYYNFGFLLCAGKGDGLKYFLEI